MAHAVEAAGGSLADVVALRLDVVNDRPADADSLGTILREFFPGVPTSPQVPELGCLRWPSQTF